MTSAESVPHLPGALKLIAMQIHRRRGDRRMAGMTVPHPMGRGTAQLFGGHRVIGLSGVSGLRKKSAQHSPKMRAGNAGVAVFPQTANQGHLRIPPFPADWQLLLCQVIVERRMRERR